MQWYAIPRLSVEERSPIWPVYPTLCESWEEEIEGGMMSGDRDGWEIETKWKEINTMEIKRG